MGLPYENAPVNNIPIQENVLVDAVIGGVGFGLYAAYHLVLYVATMWYPMRTTIGQNHASRRAWCHAMTGVVDRGLLAVQTLRNGMMASQLLANTSFAIISAFAVILVGGNFAARRGLLFTLPPGSGINFLADYSYLPPIKLFLLVLMFILAFFFYMLSIRAYYHVSFLITVPADEPKRSFPIDGTYVARILIRGAVWHTLGTRAFYAAFLALLWLFGPIPMITASVLLIALLYFIDFVPAPPGFSSTMGDENTEHQEEGEGAPSNANPAHGPVAAAGDLSR